MADERPVTLITGAGTGIGLATARLLAEKGHRIVLVGRREAVLHDAGAALGREGRDWIALAADVADLAQAAALPGRVVAQLGRLDAVVNNAGWAPLKPVAEHTAEDVAQLFAVNAAGPVVLLIAALRAMGGRGRIVNVSSMAADDPFPGLTVYGAAKVALNTLTKGLANELGPESGVKVFSVAPGAVETPLLRSLFPVGALPPERCLDPRDVAGVIAGCVLGERDGDSGRTIWLPSP